MQFWKELVEIFKIKTFFDGCFHSSSDLIRCLIYLFFYQPYLTSKKTIVASINLYRQKKRILVNNNINNNNKVNRLCMFYLYESQSSNVCFAYST